MYSERRTIDHIFGHYTAHVREAANQVFRIFDIAGVEADKDAPSTFPALMQHFNELYEKPYHARRIRVFNGGNEKTIFTDPTVNLLFRGWHDLGHMTLQAPFTREGEVAVAEWMASFLDSEIDKKILRADVIDQYDHWEKTNKFVDDQRAFVIDRVFKEAA